MKLISVVFALLSIGSLASAEELLVSFDPVYTNGYTFRTRSLIAGTDNKGGAYVVVTIDKIKENGRAPVLSLNGSWKDEEVKSLCNKIFKTAITLGSEQITVPQNIILSKQVPGAISCLLSQF